MILKLFDFFSSKKNNKSKEQTVITQLKEDKYENAVFVNKDSKRLADFVINDEINEFDLQKLADLNGINLEISRGWYPLVLELIKELNSKGWDRKVYSIKEKFAGLRFYIDNHYSLVEKYTNRSASICETCGKQGEVRYDTSWHYVACDKHYEEKRNK